MKVPAGYFDKHTDVEKWDETIKLWADAARQCSMEHGVLVEVKVEQDGKETHSWQSLWIASITRLTFAVGEHRFEGLNQLKTALKNKAFL